MARSVPSSVQPFGSDLTMHLTSHTDYALRTLLILAHSSPNKIKTSDVCATFEISENHLAKVVQSLSRLGYVETIRGKDGGIRLGCAPESIILGRVVRELEPDMGVVPCLRDGGEECFITPVCSLKPVLKDATEAFLSHLDQFSLANILEGIGRGSAPLRRRLGQRLAVLK